MKTTLLFIGKVILHLLALVTIGVLFYPLATWYFDATPVWGVDFYYTASLVNLIKQGFVLPPFGWFYAWFTGWPWVSSYPILHAYLIVPFTLFLGITSAVKLWMIITLGAYFIGIYAVCYRLSKNISVAVVLAVSAIYSVGVYGSLMWGGSLPSHATQAFYPWCILFLILHFERRKVTDLLVSALIAGIAIWGHPQIVIAYIYPTALVVSLFWVHGWKLWHRVKALVAFVLISFLIGLPLLQQSFGEATKALIVTDSFDVASSTVRMDSDTARDIQAFHRSQPKRIISDTNTTTFVVLAISAVSWVLTLLLLHKLGHFSKAILPFVVFALFYVGYVIMFAFGISIYHGGWYRLFWASPLSIGVLAAALWGQAQTAQHNRLPRTLHLVGNGILSLILVGVGIAGVLYFGQDIKERIIQRSEISSAFPEIVNLRADKTFTDLSRTLVPDWLDPHQKEYRIYSGDQTVNIWWNALYTMPLSRGYFDPPVTSQNRGYFFWLDAALSQSGADGEDQLVDSFKYPAETAFRNTMFLVDWYAVKFAEAGHAGPTAFAPLPKSLTQETYIKHEEILDFNQEKYNSGNQTLHYYEFSDDVVQPIMSATNAPTLGIFASDQGFETIIRALADSGMGSTSVIPLKLGKKIENLTAQDEKQIDALLLYDYDYSNRDRAYSIIERFLKQSKHVFIDTGTEVKETESINLPDVFPISQTIRKPMGREWELEMVDESYSDVDASLFDPPLFDDLEWNISHPGNESYVKNDATIILKNKGIPILASATTGTGVLYWSGLNLPYHVIRYHNEEEAAFFRLLVEKLLPNTELSAAYESEFISSESRKITLTNAKGVLLKEQAYPGWSASVQNGKKKETLKIYKSGPAFPGFMYVSLPTAFQKESVVNFHYRGDPKVILLMTLSFTIVMYILDSVFTRGFFFGWISRLYHKLMGKQIHGWWSKEDE